MWVEWPILRNQFFSKRINQARPHSTLSRQRLIFLLRFAGRAGSGPVRPHHPLPPEATLPLPLPHRHTADKSARRGRPRPTGHPHPVGPDPARSAHSTFFRRRLLFLFHLHPAIKRATWPAETDHALPALSDSTFISHRPQTPANDKISHLDPKKPQLEPKIARPHWGNARPHWGRVHPQWGCGHPHSLFGPPHLKIGFFETNHASPHPKFSKHKHFQAIVRPIGPKTHWGRACPHWGRAHPQWGNAHPQPSNERPQPSDAHPQPSNAHPHRNNLQPQAPHPVGPDPARSAHSTFFRRRLLFLSRTAIRRISRRGEADHALPGINLR